MSAPGSTLILKDTEETQQKTKAKEPIHKMPNQLGKLLPGKLNVSKYPQVISIFGVEHFNLVTCYGKPLSLPLPLPLSSEKNKAGSTGPKGVAGPSPANTSSPTGTSDNICVDTAYVNSNIEEASKYFGKNNSVEQQPIEHYAYKTRKEFDKLYLNHLKKDEKKLMIKLFRYIFSKEPVGALDESSEYIFSSLSPFFKMPCKNGEGEGEGEGEKEVDTNLQQRIWSLFKQCIRYRIYGSDEVDPQKIMGLNNEIGSLQKLLPRGNQEYKNKQYLRAQLLRMLELLEDNERTCMIFSNKGIEVSLSKYHSAILDLIRRTVKNLVQQKTPITEEEKSKHLALIIDEIKNLKEYNDQDSEKIYEDMMNVVSGLFNKLTGIDKKVDDLSNEFAKVNQLFNGQPLQKGGSAKTGSDSESDSDKEADADEEYERVYTTAMEHLEGIKSKETRSTLLDSVCEILGGTDLDSSIEHAVNKKGFSLSSTLARLNRIDIPESQHTKSFLRCIQTLLEIKEHQIESFVPPPPMRAGEHRYEYTMKKYPSLMQYIPKDLFTITKNEFKADIKKVEKTLRRVYPYSDTLLEDIYLIRDTVDPCCLFYKALLVKLPNLRNRCKKIVNSIPRCKEMLEEILETLQGISGDAVAVADAVADAEGITLKEITLPKGFPLLAEAIRSNLPPMKHISLPITIVEHAGEYEEVLGDKPFVLIGEDKARTFLHGIRDLDIDVTKEIDDIRKGEISMGAIMFIYLYIKCDDHIDG
jgi:hypothetical protein